MRVMTQEFMRRLERLNRIGESGCRHCLEYQMVRQASRLPDYFWKCEYYNKHEKSQCIVLRNVGVQFTKATLRRFLRADIKVIGEAWKKW